MIKRQYQRLEKDFTVQLEPQGDGEALSVDINGESFSVVVREIDAHTLLLFHDQQRFLAHIAETEHQIYVSVNDQQYILEKKDRRQDSFQPSVDAAVPENSNRICAPMPGKILKLFVKEGQEIARHERLFIVEAMKMENEVKSPRQGVVKKIHFVENDLVAVGEAIIELTESVALKEKSKG